MDRLSICLIEDDPIMGESLSDRFQLEGFSVAWFRTAHDALDALTEKPFELVISDIRLPDMSGDELYSVLLQKVPTLPPFLFITAYGSIDKAVTLLKRGAADYITKPFDLDDLMEKIRALLTQARDIFTDSGEKPRLGISRPMRALENSLPHLAQTHATVLITGESGVGKEHVARLIHEYTYDGHECPFIAVNCAALSEGLLEAELFGYERGAFTGAERTKKGVFEQAHGGSLLLDEVGDMPASMQVKLLRVLQERVVVRVGGEKEIPVAVRLICATNKDLRRLVESGEVREDLYYRINVVHVHIPPLRERKEDILWFAQLFLEQYLEQHPGEHRTIDHSAGEMLLNQPWPGNIRQLKHCIDRACILSPRERLTGAVLLSEELAFTDPGDGALGSGDESLHNHLQRLERDYIIQALNKHHWQIAVTADALDISRKNLWEKMKKLNIRAPAP